MDNDALVAAYCRTDATLVVFPQSKFVCGLCDDRRPKVAASMKQHWLGSCPIYAEVALNERFSLLSGVLSRDILANCLAEVSRYLGPRSMT